MIIKKAFQGLNAEGQPVRICIRSKEKLLDNAPLKIALQKIAVLAARAAHGSKIDVSVSRQKKSLCFEMKGLQGKVPLTSKNADKLIQEMEERQIVPDRFESDLETMLDRFSTSKKGPRTTLEKILQVLADFFIKILEMFQWLDALWEAITHRHEKKLKWDLSVLSEICGKPISEKMTLHQALQYMDQMLERERPELTDPTVNKRINNALLLSEEIIYLRNHFGEKEFKKLVDQIGKTVTGLTGGEKILLPVSYNEKIQKGENESKTVEMLLEIKKGANGTYTVTLLSTSEEMLEFFDRKMGIAHTLRSFRREIFNIGEKDFLSALPLLVELQTSPLCFQTPEGTKEPFLQALKFDGSIVKAGKTNESFRENQSFGLLNETLFYVKKERKNPEETRRFELAFRLRAFLDICKGHPRGMKDRQFWTLAKATALQLTHLLEQDKKLMGSLSEQGAELTRIYGELREVVDNLEKRPPESEESSSEPLLQGKVDMKPNKSAPKKLEPLPREKKVYEKVDPPLCSLNEKNPLESLKNWSTRLLKLMNLKKYDQAGREAKLMVWMLPKPEDLFWEVLSQKEALDGLKALEIIGKAIEKALENNDRTTFQEIGTLAMLNYFAYPLAVKAYEQVNADCLGLSRKVLLELYKTQLPLDERSYFDRVYKAFNPGQPQTKKNAKTPDEMKSLVEALSLAVTGKYQQTSYYPPLYLRAPDYAEKLLKETNKSALIEYCPFGCGRDDHYELAHDGSGHNYPTVYLLNQHETFNPQELMREGPLARDEATDLMYVQQTNQSPLSFHSNSVRSTLPLSEFFNEDDRRIQVINTLSLYFEHPHFFKTPALRWQFESKLFVNNAFNALLKPNAFSLNQPFLMGCISKFSKEIQVAAASGEIGVASYLVFVLGEIENYIEKSDLQKEEKALLKLPFDLEKLLVKWAEELIGKNDEKSREKQKMLFPILLSRYFRKFVVNSNDPFFEESKNLEMILGMVGRLESMPKSKDRIDFEKRDEYLTLIAWLAPKVRSLMDRDSSFVNKVLSYLNPKVGALNLKWDSKDFPTLQALSESGEYYQFDMLAGTLVLGKMRIELLPDNIRANQNVQKIFGKAVEKEWHVLGSPQESETLVYVNDDFPDCRIVVRKKEDIPGAFQRGSKVIIERKIEGVWHSYVRFTAQDRYLSSLLPSDHPDLPLPVAAAIGNRDCWMSPSMDNIIVLEEGTSQIFGQMSIGTYVKEVKQPSGKIIEENEYFIKKVRIQEEDLLYPKEESLSQFSTIEDSRFIRVMGRKSRFSSIHYFRYRLPVSGSPLVYHIDEKGISSSAFPGYLLQSFGVRPGKSDLKCGNLPLPRAFDGFHLLKKGGKEKVLIPMRQFDLQYTSSNERLASSKPTFPFTLESCDVCEYDLDVENNRLKAKSADDYAYLAYLSFVHWDYEGASYYLNKARTALGYGKNFEKIFGWMKQLNDSSPNAVAIQLRFELFHMEMVEDGLLRQGMAEDEPLRLERLHRIADLYWDYTKDAKGIGEGRDVACDLSSSEEEIVIDAIRELIQKAGDRDAAEKQPLISVASAVGNQIFLDKDEEDLLGIKEGAKQLWISQGNNKSSTPLSFVSPTWSLESFRDLFNQILKLDVNSLHLKELELQIRMQKEDYAQTYLLKLIVAKRENGSVYRDLLAALPDGKLHTIDGSWFVSSRSDSVEQLKAALTDQYFDRFALADHERARERAIKMIEADPEADGFDLYGLGKASRKFIDRWVKNQGDKKEFKEKFQEFLLEEIFGSGGATSLKELNRLCTILKPVAIVQPKQKIEARAALVATPKVTVKEKYRTLVQNRSVQKKLVLAKETTNLSKQVVKSRFSSVLDEKYKEAFTVKAVSAKKVDQSLFDEIEEEDPSLTRVVEEHRKDLQAFESGSKEVFLSHANASQLSIKLKQEKEMIVQEKTRLNRDILQEIERFNTPAGILAMRRLVGKAVKPSLESLIALWRRDEIAGLEKLGMRKIPEIILKQIDAMLTRYLELSTKEALLIRAQETIERYLESKEDPQLAEELYDLISTQRAYDFSDEDARDLLFIEYVDEIILRSQQIKIVREMLVDPNAARQLRMGDGKSKVLLPILAKRKANGGNLVILMLPEDLVEQNCRDLERTNRFLFGQKMHRFEFSRNSDRSEKALKVLYNSLCKTVMEKGFIMSTKRALLSFRDAYLELFCNLEKAENQEARVSLLAQIRAMSQIMELFSARADVIADEIDACLDVRKEVNFSMGESTPIDPVKVNIGAELMQMIFSAKENEPLYELSQALLNNMQAAFPSEKRNAFLRELAKSYHAKYRLSEISVEAFADYATDTISSPAVKVMEWVFALKKNDKALFKKLTTVKAFLCQGLSTSLSRVGNVNYGRDPESGKWTIPYKANNAPRVGSEFDDEIEKIAFTLQDYVQKGVNYAQVSETITEMRRRATREMRQSDPSLFMTINETEAGLEFKAFLQEIDPEETMGSHVSLAMMDNELALQLLVATINRTSKGRLLFCHSQVVQKIVLYPNQIHSVSADVADIVRNFGGFTGTPWNLHSFHDKIHAEKNLGVDGSTWALMLGREVPIRSFVFDATKPFDSLLNNLSLPGEYQAFVDTGAYLRGTDNGDFIERVLEKKKGTAGIYFDETGRIVKKKEGVFPIELAPYTDLMDNFTLYDQAHTVGADIQQAKKAKAVVSIGENTFIRDLFQAVWRLRQLHRQQRITLVVSEKIKELILDGEERPLTKEDILKFCLKNEALREAEDNFRSEKEKIQGGAKRVAMGQMAHWIADGASDESIVEAAKIFGETKLFIKDRAGEESFDQYGRLKALEKPAKVIERIREEVQEKCEELAVKFQAIKSPIAPAFTAFGKEMESRPLISSALCPEVVKSGQEDAGEVEIEAQAEVEQEMEVETETETETETEVESETLVPMVMDGEGGHGEVQPLWAEEIQRHIEMTYGRVWYKLREISNSLDFFDDGIFVSAMVERNLSLSKKPISPQAVFYSNRKPVKQVIIAKHNNTWTAIVPSTHEAHGPARDYFARADQATQAVQVALSSSSPLVVHKSGVDRTQALPFTDAADVEQFYLLYVQVKLFNGEMEYGKEERGVLKKWLVEKGAKKFKEYFEKNILPIRPKRFRDSYPKSTLAKVFAEVCEA